VTSDGKSSFIETSYYLFWAASGHEIVNIVWEFDGGFVSTNVWLDNGIIEELYAYSACIFN